MPRVTASRWKMTLLARPPCECPSAQPKRCASREVAMGIRIPAALQPLVRVLGEQALALALSALLLGRLYGLPGRDLRVPLVYDGDALDAVLYARTVADHGW